MMEYKIPVMQRWYVVLPLGVVCCFLAFGALRYVVSSLYELYNNQRDAASFSAVLDSPKLSPADEAVVDALYWQVRWRSLMRQNLTWRVNVAENQEQIDVLIKQMNGLPGVPAEIKSALNAWAGVYGRSRVDLATIQGLEALSQTEGWDNARWRDEDRYKLMMVLLSEIMNVKYQQPEKQFDSWWITALMYTVGGQGMLTVDRMGMGDPESFSGHWTPFLIKAVYPVFKDLVDHYPEKSVQKVYLFDIGAMTSVLKGMGLEGFNSNIPGTNQINCSDEVVRKYFFIRNNTFFKQKYALSQSNQYRIVGVAKAFRWDDYSVNYVKCN